MEQLFSQLSYDVRQSVHHVNGLLDLIGEEPLSRNQAHLIARCRTIMDQLLRTSEDIAAVTSPEKSPAGQPSAIVLADAVQEITELMQVLAAHKSLSLTAWVDSSAARVVIADRSLIQESLRRLLDSAIRFSTGGSLQLSVQMTASREAGRSHLVVDLTSTVALPPEGDLGLKVLERRLSDADGNLSVSSGDGQGTAIRMSLPVEVPAADAYPDDQDSDAAAAAEPGNARLLIAEDSDDSFLLIQTYLKGTNYRITRAQDGAQAVGLATSGEFDLILMDAHMPMMDGYEATRRIREWETERGRVRVPILLMSADNRARQLRMGGQVGCSGYVPKPNTKAQVLPALQYFLTQNAPGEPVRTQ